MDWRTFWNEDHAIYVDAKHRAVHAELVAIGIVANLPAGAPRVLDWGCGEAEGARLVARRCSTLFLFDSAPRVRESLRARYADDRTIVVLDDDELSAIADTSLDCAAIVSVAQYLEPDVFGVVLALLHAKLAAGSRLIVADIIPPDLSPVADARALLSLAWHNGFFGAALLGLVRTFFSNYRKLRGELGLTRWSEAEMLAMLQRHGFASARISENIGHNQKRMTFVGVRN